MSSPDPGSAAPTDPRCPSCGAAVRADAPWCTQCFHDLRPAPPEPEPVAPPTAAPRVPVADPSYDPVATDPLTGPLPGVVPASAGEPTWPCTTCGQDNPLALTACLACGSGFLAAVRESEAPLLVLPGVGDISRLGRGQRLGLAGVVVLVVVLVTVVLGLLFG